MNRRNFLANAGKTFVLFANSAMVRPDRAHSSIVLFLCGDVMTGRGIDQVLPNRGNPRLFEPYMTSARGYVRLAEERHGPLPRRVPFAYIWGDALTEFDRLQPDLRIINLETSVTESDDHWPGKGIHYRMHPANIPCLTAAGIDCCTLANNHVLDWGYSGLEETLATLRQSRISFSGAGENAAAAQAPAVLQAPGKGRVLIFSFGAQTSGIPSIWAAPPDRPGVNLLEDLSETAVRRVLAQVQRVKRAGDVAVASIHWGGNWGYAIPDEQTWFAHRLIDTAGVDLVHGHSSHHPKGIEVYNGKLILYGCGDFLNDYEGISGHEQYRDDLGLMYFARLEPASGSLVGLHMTPTQIKRFKVNYATAADAAWLAALLNRVGAALGTSVDMDPDRTLRLHWKGYGAELTGGPPSAP